MFHTSKETENYSTEQIHLDHRMFWTRLFSEITLAQFLYNTTEVGEYKFVSCNFLVLQIF